MGKPRAVIVLSAFTSVLLALAGCGPNSSSGECDPYFQDCLCHAADDCTAPWFCGSSGRCELPPEDGGLPDVGPVDSAAPDATVDSAVDAAVRFGFGEPCSDKLQCQSYICIFVATGGFCSMLCQAGSCPTGFGCVGVLDAVEQGVVSDVCVPEANLLCTMCASHNECSLIGQDLCLPDPLGGSFCARDCSVVSCPMGYVCEDVELAGLPFRQCLPESGSCNCTAATAGNTSPCDLTTPFGTCQGTRECLGSAGWGECEAPGVSDEPDDTFTDDDCDGIDGEIDGGIYVSTMGLDDATCGLTYQAPCRTVNHGILQAAVNARAWVYIQAGTYYEVIALAEGIHLVGGFDASWQRAPRTTAGHTVTVVGGVDSGTGQYMTMRAYGLGAPTRILDLVLVGPAAIGQVDGNGRSSYVLWAVSSSGLSIERITFQAGNGMDGANGDYGLDAPSVTATTGMHGGTGGAADSYSTACDTSSRGAGGSAGTNSCTSGRAPSGGSGGAGGTMDTSCTAGVCTSCSATSGLTGGNAAYYAAGSYGYRGAGSSPCSTPGAGNGGLIANGAAGTGGAGGVVSNQFWYAKPGTAGTTGDNGSGGGGGGGSGGCDSGTDSYGAGGGGGGAGGCAARGGGSGGGGGGGSFGLFLVSSSVTATDCLVTGGSGGNGGIGGQGGQGQSGGSTGQGGGAAGGSQPGGAGGAGAHGGHGGGGGGGGGGVSYGVYGVGSPALPLCTFSGGHSGLGGQGGLSAPGATLVERDGANGAVGQSAPPPSHLGSCSSPPDCI